MITQSSRQQGLSLVELLIAMVLGLLLTAGALEMMLSSQNLHQTTDSLSRIQESGRFALDFLAKDIRMAGYGSLEDASADGDLFRSQAGCNAFDPCTRDGGGNSNDQIAVLVNPSSDNDCTGVAVSESTVVANIYFVDDPENDQISSLYCRGYNITLNTWYGNPQPLVDGIENLQILYGLADPGANNEVTSYVSADSVTDWASIAAARISILINNGQANGNSDNVTRTFNILDAAPYIQTDRHARKVFTTTTAINNIVYQNLESNQ